MNLHYQSSLTLFFTVIQALGEQLKFRQQVIATGTVYFKRFYARYVLILTNICLSFLVCIHAAM